MKLHPENAKDRIVKDISQMYQHSIDEVIIKYKGEIYCLTKKRPKESFFEIYNRFVDYMEGNERRQKESELFDDDELIYI